MEGAAWAVPQPRPPPPDLERGVPPGGSRPLKALGKDCKKMGETKRRTERRKLAFPSWLRTDQATPTCAHRPVKNQPKGPTLPPSRHQPLLRPKKRRTDL